MWVIGLVTAAASGEIGSRNGSGFIPLTLARTVSNSHPVRDLLCLRGYGQTDDPPDIQGYTQLHYTQLQLVAMW
jgi:hypothetical protein